VPTVGAGSAEMTASPVTKARCVIGFIFSFHSACYNATGGAKELSELEADVIIIGIRNRYTELPARAVPLDADNGVICRVVEDHSVHSGGLVSFVRCSSPVNLAIRSFDSVGKFLHFVLHCLGVVLFYANPFPLSNSVSSPHFSQLGNMVCVRLYSGLRTYKEYLRVQVGGGGVP